MTKKQRLKEKEVIINKILDIFDSYVEENIDEIKLGSRWIQVKINASYSASLDVEKNYLHVDIAKHVKTGGGRNFTRDAQIYWDPKFIRWRKTYRRAKALYDKINAYHIHKQHCKSLREVDKLITDVDSILLEDE